MYYFFRLYYRLTSFVPRLLPRSEGEYRRLKKILSDYFDVPDRPEIWYTVGSFISSTPMPKVRRSYRFYMNAARRMDMNQAAQRFREKANEELKKLIEEKVKKMKDEEEKNAAQREKENGSATTGPSREGAIDGTSGVAPAGAEAESDNRAAHWAPLSESPLAQGT